MEVNDVDARIDSLQYAGTGDMTLLINQFVAKIHPTIEGVNKDFFIPITETKAQVEMDSTTLRIPRLSIKTEDSRLQMAMKMDFNAFDSINPGQLKLDAEAQVGHDDVRSAIFGFMPETDA